MTVLNFPAKPVARSPEPEARDRDRLPSIDDLAHGFLLVFMLALTVAVVVRTF